MAKPKIHLHAVLAELDKVKRQLQAAKKGATADEMKDLGLLIKGVSAVRASTTRLCPKAQGVWPAQSTTKPKKTRSK